MPYYAPKIEELEKELKSGGTPNYCNYPVWTPREEVNRIRILPPWSPRGSIFKVLYIHWFGSKDNMQSCICRRMFRKRCFICEEVTKLLANGVLTQEQARKYSPKRRAFCNGIDMNDIEKGVQIMSLPVNKVVDPLMKFYHNPEYGDFTHPETGYDITIERESSGMFPDYRVIPARSSTPLKNKEWLDQLFDLDDFENVWRVHSYDEQKELWLVYSDIVKPEDDLGDDLPVDRITEGGKTESKLIDDEFDVNALLEE